MPADTIQRAARLGVTAMQEGAVLVKQLEEKVEEALAIIETLLETCE